MSPSAQDSSAAGEQPKLPSGLDPAILHRDVIVEASAANLQGMLHRAEVRDFTIFSDEPPSMGGDNAYPAPLFYFVSATAF
jgi:hypothetical protein